MNVFSLDTTKVVNASRQMTWTFVAWLLGASALHADLPVKVEPREWSDVSGQFSVTATIVNSDEYHVALEKVTGETVKVPRRRLTDHDNQYIEAVDVVASTLDGIGAINQVMVEVMLEVEKLEGSAGSQTKVQDVMRHHQIIDNAATELVALHVESKDAISGVLAGTLLSLGKDARSGVVGASAPVVTNKRKLKESEKYLEEGLVRLRGVHQHLPGYYSLALVTGLNNRAVLALKRGQTSKAAVLFSEATQVVDETPVAIVHNIALLISLSLQNNPLFELGTSQQQWLKDHAAEQAPGATDPHLPNRFFYSTAYEGSTATPQLPAPGSALGDTLRQLELWPEVTCFLCSGAGYLDCRRCVNGAISFRQRQQVGVNHLGQPVFGQVAERVKCETCKATGALKCKQCTHGQISIRD